MRLGSLPFAVILVALSWLESLAAQEKPIAILPGRMIDGLGGPPLEDAAVILEGNKVAYAGAAKQREGSAGLSEERREREDRDVLAWADMQVHLQGGWDGISMDLLGYQRLQRHALCRNHHADGYGRRSALDPAIEAGSC